MVNQALEAAKAQIADAFRTERKERQHILLQGHRVWNLVTNDRYPFFDACRGLEINAKQVKEALDWMVDDNARLNATYNVEIHCCTPGDYVMTGWFAEQEEKKVIALPISRGENTKFLDAAE